ncbi:protein SYM1-like [Mizuhopecten yessoensis]|uniref:Protein SYM1 n=1 Tax=Mizuhopecten yessoensis TaxID=6573 RepID=A0A210R0N3_MIZYE|nr:protein SYM1-like [Mizuhopecten yessoensis]XP_021344024.1 protein SYM1-like [Mizuhopecten yessoensis]XP_021344032.1 protein SYM1-like [Mizuhopecten yessoensis]OWF54578.1 Protein SYM1 [Mizuhopecten yessoensis]
MIKAVGYYGSLWLVADFVEQKIVCKKVVYDPYKAARSVTVGGGVVAPLVYTWMKVGEKILPGRSLRTALMKVCIDAFVFGPVAISSFYMSSSLLEGKSWQGSVEEWKKKLAPTIKRAWCLWPGVQLLNFMFVPPTRRVYFVGTVSLFWSVFLLYMKDDAVKHGARTGLDES